MTDADRNRFAKVLYVLGDVFNEPVSDVRAEAYCKALSDLPIEAVERAGAAAITACKFFPKPIELRELLHGSRDDQATLAWGELLREVRRVGYTGCPAFTHLETMQKTIRSLWGSWSRLCNTLPGEGPELIGWMKQFQAHYQAVQQREQLGGYPELSPAEAAKVLAGIVEQVAARSLPSAETPRRVTPTVKAERPPCQYCGRTKPEAHTADCQITIGMERARLRIQEQAEQFSVTVSK